eukprot:m.5400 g.5400  ORF g.5400 m.5400 type:complete len:66 (-) comp4180_c0_seq1:444-641(-)
MDGKRLPGIHFTLCFLHVDGVFIWACLLPGALCVAECVHCDLQTSSSHLEAIFVVAVVVLLSYSW